MNQRLVVNCIHANERCDLRGIDLRGSVCARCAERVARESRPEPIWFITIGGDRANSTRPGEYRLCKERLAEEWPEALHDRIRALAIRETRTCLFLPADKAPELLALRKSCGQRQP